MARNKSGVHSIQNVFRQNGSVDPRGALVYFAGGGSAFIERVKGSRIKSNLSAKGLAALAAHIGNAQEDHSHCDEACRSVVWQNAVRRSVTVEGCIKCENEGQHDGDHVLEGQE